ncbi:UNVERIFIED_CONTAM: hypothetical protein FKN15_074639 [Acipenser sinensis]
MILESRWCCSAVQADACEEESQRTEQEERREGTKRSLVWNTLVPVILVLRTSRNRW